jgi:hypothetical protein
MLMQQVEQPGLGFEERLGIVAKLHQTVNGNTIVEHIYEVVRVPCLME